MTRTASLHTAARKLLLFDDYLAQQAAQRGEPFRPFDADENYRRFVDGVSLRGGGELSRIVRPSRCPMVTPPIRPRRRRFAASATPRTRCSRSCWQRAAWRFSRVGWLHPHPDTVLEAARRLSVEPARAAVWRTIAGVVTMSGLGYLDAIIGLLFVLIYTSAIYSSRWRSARGSSSSPGGRCRSD